MSDERFRYSTLRRVIRTRREFLKLTQQQVAEKIGTQPEFVGMIEGGKRRIHIDRLAFLADALQLDRKEVCCLGLYEHAPHLYHVLFGDAAPQPDPSNTAATN
jgi:transcriptional regulator with XRE-family HTH domain